MRLIGVAILLAFGQSALAQFPTGWAGYDNVDPMDSATVSGYVYRIPGNKLSAGFAAAVQADGDDIRATDEAGTQLPVDVISFSSNGTTCTGLIAVYVSDASDSDLRIRLYAGKADATKPADDSTYGRENAYPSTFRMYIPSGLGTDRTGYDNDSTDTGSPSAGGVAGQLTGSTATDLNGTAQYGTVSASIPSTYPVTLVCDVNADNVTAFHPLIYLHNSGTTTDFHLIAAAGTDANDGMQGATRHNGASQVNAITTAGYTAGAWHQASYVCTNATSRRAGINGLTFANNTTSRTPVGINRIRIGEYQATFYLGGLIANTEVHTVALSDAYLAYRRTNMNSGSFYGTPSWVSLVTDTLPKNNVSTPSLSLGL